MMIIYLLCSYLLGFWSALAVVFLICLFWAAKD